MSNDLGPRHGMRRTSAAASSLILLLVAACGGSGAAGPDRPSGGPTDTELSASAPVALDPGGWQGTITFRAVLDTDSSETTSSGQGVYAETTTERGVTQADVTDTFSVSGRDPEDITYGIDGVELTGDVANSGTTLERYTYESDKHNALGCHWTGETGTEISGSWSHDSSGVGSISFSEDGSYRIQIYVGGDPATGEQPPTPQLPKRLWETNTILEGAERDCPGPGTEQTTTEGPVVEWASSILGPYDSIEGTLDPANPGSVIDGTATFEITSPEATLTVTWHLAHDGPIVLPHS